MGKEELSVATIATIDEANGRTRSTLTVPTPTREYSQRLSMMQVVNAGPTPAPRAETLPIPIPIPFFSGARVLMWKQDPTVLEIGIRKAYLPRPVLTGPRDARIRTQGVPSVSPNLLGDLIETPGTDAFDTVHTFSVVRQTLTMCQRARGGAPLPWQWNSITNADPLDVFPKAGETMNAFYMRSAKAIKFFFFNKPGDPPTAPKIFTCRSLDIVAHETGHAILDGLKPGWLNFGNPPQTGALHESFGDMTAIFLALSQLDQVEAVIAQTKSNLHDKTFLSDVAEQFGLVLGRPNGLRNADNDLRLSQVSNEVHDLSQVFTGAIYDVLADIFSFERNISLKDDAAVLHSVAQYVWGLVLRAIIAAPASGATFADVANQMLIIANSDGKPVQYRNFIRNRFTVREVVVSPVPLSRAGDQEAGVEMVAAEHISTDKDVPQDRSGCCGTMQLPEYTGAEKAVNAEIDELIKSLQSAPSSGNGNGSSSKTNKDKNKKSATKGSR